MDSYFNPIMCTFELYHLQFVYTYTSCCTAVKRLMREAKELNAATSMYHAQPLEDNLFEWHFTVQGPKDTAFEGGRYHGRIILPPDYPMKPPSIIMLTVSSSDGNNYFNTVYFCICVLVEVISILNVALHLS